MMKLWRNKDSRRNLLSAFIVGSLLVMVISLTMISTYFAIGFSHKEEKRAEISREQLSHFFTFQYSQMAEEMWTDNYEAIAVRVSLIAKEMGNAKYEVFLSDAQGNCVFRQDKSGSSKSCEAPSGLRELVKTPNSLSGWKPTVGFDSTDKTYVYMVPLSVGSTLKGYLYAKLTDPYDFYRGGTVSVVGRTLAPAVAIIILVWFLWLLVCRKFFLKRYLQSLEEMKNNEALARLAGQTAHDMRDPLSWIDKLTASLEREIPEQKRVMIKSAVLQLKDIANGLLSHKKVFTEEKRGNRDLEDVDVELMSSIVGRIVSEKRLQFKTKSGLAIEAPLDAESYGLFARIQSNEFKRVLSNLINNGVDAVECRGRVTVKICSCKESVKIQIIDNGKGIPPEIMPKLGVLGATFGKKKGNGLGLYHAKTVVESWGGTLQLSSSVGQGTIVEIRLPSVKPPQWFVPHLEVSPGTTIVVLDDHPSIHQTWKERFDFLGIQGVNVESFQSAGDAIEWLASSARLKPFLFLCDYELTGQNRIGLELIEELDLQNRAILVTSYYEDEDVRDRCLQLGVKLIPKELASFVPIKVSNSTPKGSGVIAQPSARTDQESAWSTY